MRLFLNSAFDIVRNILYQVRMLEWLFGKKQEKKEEKKEDQLGKDEKWIYDYIKQYLSSPIWRNPLLDFIQENCLIFEDTEENKFQYTKIFQEFTGLTALLLQSMIEEVGINEKTFQKCLIKGMKSERDSKIFQQILLCDNFLAFKKIMVSKNKELEVEAMKKIHQESKKESKAEENQIEIDSKELERLELEKAIAMSMAVQEKAISQEEKELEEAIRLSQAQYQKEEEKRIESKKEEKKKTVKMDPLPPIGSSHPPRPLQEYKEEETKMKQEIQIMKKQEQIRRAKEKDELENEQSRKKRLLQQREMIRKKKQAERKEELSTFMQNKPSESQALSEEEMERRRNLMKRLKQQLKQ